MSAIEPRHFKWERADKVATITLNRPERKNPLTLESYAELRDLFRNLQYAEGITNIVITGAGGNFCSGGDVHEIIGPLTKMDMAGLMAFTRMTGALVREMRSCPQPIIAASVGLAGCDMGACAILPRIIGQGRASELLYTGRSMSADEGLAWGFFNQILSSEKVLAHAQSMAQSLADGPAFAHAMTKKCLHQEWNLSIEQAIETEAEAQAICMQTNDFERAYNAFVAKQKPKFEGN